MGMPGPNLSSRVLLRVAQRYLPLSLNATFFYGELPHYSFSDDCKQNYNDCCK